MTAHWTQTIARISTGLFAAGLLVAGSGTAFAATGTTTRTTTGATGADHDSPYHSGAVSGTFMVTGSGAADDVVTDQPGRTLNLGAQNLPFSRTFTAPAGTQLLQIHVTSHGPASCKIVFGGKVVASDSGPFGADCVYQTI